MKSKMNLKVNVIVMSLIAIGVITRFIPHPPNFTAIGAIALFGGAYFTSKRLAVLLPLLVLFLSDLAFQIFIPEMGFHKTIPFVYFSFILISLTGFYLRENKSWLRIAGYSLLSSVIFFVISNFGSWLFYYPQNFQGLVSCYIAAIPFFHYNVLGDFFFNGILFLSAYFIFQNSAVRANLNE